MGDILAIDVGGSAIKYAIVSKDMALSCKGKVPAPRDTCEGFLDAVAGLWERYGSGCEGIAVSMAGKLDPADGRIVSSGAFPDLLGRRLVPLVSGRCGCPVSVENDGSCAGLAELNYGSLRGRTNALCLVLGTGIGAALFIDGRLYRGSRLCAPEPSFVRVGCGRDFDDSWCMRGGATGLVRMAKDALGVDRDIDGIEVFRLADEGDERILAMLDEYAEITAVQLYNLQALLDLEAISIGGGISASDRLMDLVTNRLEAIFAAEEQYSFPPKMPVVERCTFGNDANLIGAWHHFKCSCGEGGRDA